MFFNIIAIYILFFNIENFTYKSSADDCVNEVDSLIHLASQIKNPNSANLIKIYAQAFQLSTSCNYQVGKIHILISIAEIHFQNNRISESEINYNKALSIFWDIRNENLKVNLLIKIARSYLKINNYEGAINLLIKAKSIFEKSNNINNYLFLLKLLGTIFYRMDRFDEALFYYDAGYKISQKRGFTDSTAMFQYHKGYAYNALCQYDLALECAFNSLDMYDNSNSDYDVSRTYTLISSIYLDLKNYSQALQFEKSALKLKKKIDEKFLIANSLISIGNCYYHLNKLDSAIVYFNKAFKLEKSIEFDSGVAISLNQIGRVYYKTGRLDSALYLFKEGYRYAQIANDKYVISDISNNIGRIFIDTQDLDSAKIYLDQALKLSKAIKAKDLVIKAILSLSILDERQKIYKEALKKIKRYLLLNDSLILANSHKVNEMQLRYETTKRKKEKELFENHIAIQELKLQRANLIFGLLILGIVLIIGLLAYLLSRYREKNLKSKLLKSQVTEAIEKQKEQHQIIVHQASLSSLGTITAAIAHEINQPLQNLLLTADSLKMEIKKNSPLSGEFQNIYQDIDRIYKTVHHVRCFSSRQKEDLNVYFDINQSIEDAFSLIKRQVAKYEIIVDFKLSSDIPRCVGNPYKFEQVILNLFSNAIDAINQKNALQSKFESKLINISTYHNNEFSITVFTDNGIGITNEFSKKIFLPFYSTKKVGAGTGLGLSIAKSIIEEMSGTISYCGKQCEKTVFEIKLPYNVSKDN
jgi:signal transduction histidine kinase